MATFNNGDTYLSIRELLNDTGLRKNNFEGSTAPTIDADTSEGYEVGSLWLDTTTNTMYYAVDVTNSAAVWRELDLAGSYGNVEVQAYLDAQGYSNVDLDAQTLAWDSGNANLSITNGNTITLDGVTAQDISWDEANSNLSITGGSTVTLTGLDTQSLSWDEANSNLSISGGNQVTLTGVGANVAGIYTIESSSAGGSGTASGAVTSWIGCPSSVANVDKIWTLKHNTDDGYVYGIVTFTSGDGLIGYGPAIKRAGFGDNPGGSNPYGFWGPNVNNLTGCTGFTFSPVLLQSRVSYANVEDIPTMGIDHEGYIQYLGSEFTFRGLDVGNGIQTQPIASTGALAVGNAADADYMALAIGNDTDAGQYSVALGRYAKATLDNSIVINSTNTIASTDNTFGIDIRTSAEGSLTYDTANAWAFGANVSAPYFIGDGSQLTNLPSSNVTGVYTIESSSAGGTGTGDANVQAWIGCPAASTAVDKVWTVKHNTDDGYVYALVSYTYPTAGFAPALRRSGFGDYSGQTYSFFGSAVTNLTGCAAHGGAYFPVLLQSAETYASVDDVPTMGLDSDGYIQYLGPEYTFRGIDIGSNLATLPIAQQDGVAIGDGADADTSGVSIGSGSHAGQQSVAIGLNADASTNFTTAIGFNALATGSAGSALGHECEATGAATVAMGSDCTATVVNAIAIGYKSDVSGVNSIAIGNDMDVSGTQTVAIAHNPGAYSVSNAVLVQAGGTTKFEVYPDVVNLTATNVSLTYDSTNAWVFGANVSAPNFGVEGAGSGTISSTDSITLDGANGVINQTGVFRLANMDTTTRNGLTAANGDMIYNTTAGRIQAYQAGGWINLDDGTAA